MNDQFEMPNPRFSVPASGERLARVAAALKSNNIEAFVVRSRTEARTMIHKLVPKGAEVFTATSRTLEELGIATELNETGDHDAVRPKLAKMDRAFQHKEMRELGARPEYIVGSVHAITDDGVVMVASMSGSQIGPYASGSGNVIWVVGAQKIVRSVDEGFERIDQYCLRLEGQRMRDVYGIGSAVNKVLIVKKESAPSRSSVILVEDVIGF